MSLPTLAENIERRGGWRGGGFGHIYGRLELHETNLTHMETIFGTSPGALSGPVPGPSRGAPGTLPGVIGTVPRPPGSTPVHVRGPANHQTLHLCRSERSRATKLCTRAWPSACESPNVTPVHVRALASHQTLHTCMSESSRVTKHYTRACPSARESPNITPVQVRALPNHQTRHLCRSER